MSLDHGETPGSIAAAVRPQCLPIYFSLIFMVSGILILPCKLILSSRTY